MKGIFVKGGNQLNGDVFIGGMKNSALPIIFATVLTGDTCVIDNVPPVKDIETALLILEGMGAEVRRLTKNSVSINTANIRPCTSDRTLSGELRGSSYLLGAELGRFGVTRVSLPGGCSIGNRPLDLHMMALEALGAKMEKENGYIQGQVNGRLQAGSIEFEKVTVGGTVNAILASVLAEGTTTILNAACEPHIVDLATFLNCCGARIYGAGTNRINVHGVSSLHGCRHSILPDMIEAGTYMAAVAVTGGCVRIYNVVPKHLESITRKLRTMGVTIIECADFITVTAGAKSLRATDVITGPYPAFPTDMQPQIAAALCYAEGFGTITESVFESRYKYADELNKLGANIRVNGNSASVSGGSKMTAAPMKSTDLRGGAAMIIAALGAKGESVITNAEVTIDRGYYDIVGKLLKLGAVIERRDMTEADAAYYGITEQA